MRSIRNKLIITYLTLGMITVTIAGLFSFFLIIHNARQQEKEYLHAAARSIARQIEEFGRPTGLTPEKQGNIISGRSRFGGGIFSRAAGDHNFIPAPVEALSPEVHQQIQELADTASILHNIRIEVLTPRQELLVRSGESMSDFSGFQQPKQNGSGAGRMDFFYTQFTEILERNQELKEEIASYSDIDLNEIIILRKGQGIPNYNFNFQAEDKQRLLLPQFPAPFLFANIGNTAERAFLYPIGNAQLPSGFINISGGPNFTAGAVITARNSLLISSLAAVGIALFIGFAMGKKITTPIILLSRAAAKMADGDMNAKVDIKKQHLQPGKADEISALSIQFNEMADKIKTSFDTISKERDVLRLFMQDASHHLRTPVTALTTFNELLINTQDSISELPEQGKIKELLIDSRGQLARLRWIIDKLLNLSRLDSQVIQLDKQQVSIEHLIDQAWQSAVSASGNEAFYLEKSINSDCTAVFCDAAWIETAVANLFDNAIKYSRIQETSQDPVTVSVSRQESAILITVADHGRGMDAEQLTHIFERFYRGPTQGIQGTGLGLSIVWSIINAHEGTITAESNPGKGSKFHISLPDNL